MSFVVSMLPVAGVLLLISAAAALIFRNRKIRLLQEIHTSDSLIFKIQIVNGGLDFRRKVRFIHSPKSDGSIKCRSCPSYIGHGNGSCKVCRRFRKFQVSDFLDETTGQPAFEFIVDAIEQIHNERAWNKHYSEVKANLEKNRLEALANKPKGELSLASTGELSVVADPKPELVESWND